MVQRNSLYFFHKHFTRCLREAAGPKTSPGRASVPLGVPAVRASLRILPHPASFQSLPSRREALHKGDLITLSNYPRKGCSEVELSLFSQTASNRMSYTSGDIAWVLGNFLHRKNNKGQLAVVEITGIKDSFYWAKLCLSRLPVAAGIHCFEARNLDVLMCLWISG